MLLRGPRNFPLKKAVSWDFAGVIGLGKSLLQSINQVWILLLVVRHKVRINNKCLFRKKDLKTILAPYYLSFTLLAPKLLIKSIGLVI